MAKFLLPQDGQWVGPPVLKLKMILYKDMILDGRKRFNEHRARGLKTEIPYLVVNSHYMAIKQLILNGHSERAAMHALTYAPEFAINSTRALSSMLDISTNKLQPYIKNLKDPTERHKLPRRAIKVVDRLRQLYKRKLEGDNDISLTDLENALGEFLE